MEAWTCLMRVAAFSGALCIVLPGPAHVDHPRCTASELAKVLASDGVASDLFGTSVAICGDVVVVGASEDGDNGAGSAYVYRFDSGTPDVWLEEAKLLASDGAPQDRFGGAVAIYGDVVVVGASGDDDSTGSAYVYRFDLGARGGWVQEARLTASDGGPGELFGCSVAVSGDIIVVGAFGGDSFAGAAYVYRFDPGEPSSWQEETKLTASDGTYLDLFGVSVAVSGDVIVAGAFEDDDNGTSSGSAYVFQFDGLTWPEQAKLTASDGAGRDQFGWSVAVSGGVIVVGARNNDSAGAVYVYRFDPDEPAQWLEELKLTASETGLEALFGMSVAVSGDVIVVGASDDDSSGVQSGAAYAFRFDGCTWQEEAVLLASDGATGDQFGVSLGLSGDVVVVGAESDDDYGPSSGAAYLYRGMSNCNANDMLDICDILMGTSEDLGGDGIPDECQADTDGDGISDVLDVCPYTPSPGGVDLEGRPLGDLDHDCDVDLVDFSGFMLSFGANSTE